MPVSPFRSPVQNRQIPAKAKSGRLSSSANQCVTFGRLSVHSQNDVAGTPFGLEPSAPIGRLRIAYVGDRRGAKIWRWREAPAHHGKLALPVRRGADNGRHCVRVDEGRSGKLPNKSRCARKRRRMASWLRVMLYKLRTDYNFRTNHHATKKTPAQTATASNTLITASIIPTS
jgi:hypothetical protein